MRQGFKAYSSSELYCKWPKVAETMTEAVRPEEPNLHQKHTRLDRNVSTKTENKKELVWNRLAARSRHWWIDPNGGGYHGWAGRMVDKALRMGEISRG
jgi:hypothetical protein